MPADNKYPGVYVAEIPTGAHGINGVPTSIAAFVGAAKRGPINNALRIASWSDFERRFGSLDAASEMSYGVRQFFENGGTDAWIVRVVGTASHAQLELSDDATTGALRVTSLDPGVCGNDIEVRVDHPSSRRSTRFAMGVTRRSDGVTESFIGLSMNPRDAHYVVKVVNRASQLVSVESLAAGLHPRIGRRPAVVVHELLTGGTEVAYTSANVHQVFIGDRSKREGLYALDAAEDISLLVLPGVTDSMTLTDAVTYCEERKAFLIVDAPAAATTPPQMIAEWSGTSLPKSDHAAIYYPWIQIPDPLTSGQPRVAAPSGSIAGVYARNDAVRGVWKSPAGTDAIVQGATAPVYALNNQEIGSLNPLGVNCIRTLANGVVVWGARTLRGADQFGSEYKYVPVRRLALFIEASVSRGTEWAVFEPNDERLWSEFRLKIGAFMLDLWRQGALQGSTPRDAFFVQCDGATTTSAEIALGVVNIIVGFAPLRPAEFVIIRIQQAAGQGQS